MALRQQQASPRCRPSEVHQTAAMAAAVHPPAPTLPQAPPLMVPHRQPSQLRHLLLLINSRARDDLLASVTAAFAAALAANKLSINTKEAFKTMGLRIVGLEDTTFGSRRCAP